MSELPYIVPILERGVEHTNYLLVVADAHGALITRHTDFTRSSEALEAEGDSDPKPSSLADRVNELVGDTSFSAMYLVGDVDLRSGLLAALPECVRQRAIPLPITVRRGGYDFEEIQWAIDTTMLQRRRSAMDTAAARFTAELGRRSGLATQGLAAVCAALRQGGGRHRDHRQYRRCHRGRRCGRDNDRSRRRRAVRSGRGARQDTAGRRGAAAVGDFGGSVRGPHRRADRPGRRSRCGASLPAATAAARSQAGGGGGV